jgi:hypothetical protein
VKARYRTELRELRSEVRQQELLIKWLLRQLELRRTAQAANSSSAMKGTACSRSSD